MFIVLGSWKTGVAHVKSETKKGGQKTCLIGSPNAPRVKDVFCDNLPFNVVCPSRYIFSSNSSLFVWLSVCKFEGVCSSFPVLVPFPLPLVIFNSTRVFAGSGVELAS